MNYKLDMVHVLDTSTRSGNGILISAFWGAEPNTFANWHSAIDAMIEKLQEMKQRATPLRRE